MIPLSIYVARRTGQRRWIIATGAHGLGALATLSRTSILMLVVVGVVFVRLRPRETKRAWPVLLAAIVLSKAIVPGAIGTLRYEFLPKGNVGSLISQQEKSRGGPGEGRVADLGPAFAHFGEQPILGQGYGTRTTGIWGATDWNSQIVDDQWLKSLLETGLLGVAGWAWMFFRFSKRARTVALADQGPRGWLLVALSAAVSAYAVGMFTYDAFSFIQVTFVLFFLLALGAVTLNLGETGTGASENASPPG